MTDQRISMLDAASQVPVYNASLHTTIEPDLLARLGVDTLFDVGANAGQFARYMYEIGYRGKIVSFEPLVDAHADLLRTRASSLEIGRKDPRCRYFRPEDWIVAPRCALGSRSGELPIHVSDNSVASSFLVSTETCVRTDPSTRTVAVETCPVSTLDSVFESYVQPGQVAALKLDVQGYEMEVLLGAERCLRSFAAIQFEASLEVLYEGEAIWHELVTWLEARGFVVHDVIPAWRDPASGRLLQVDVVMVRAGS